MVTIPRAAADEFNMRNKAGYYADSPAKGQLTPAANGSQEIDRSPECWASPSALQRICI